MEIVRSFKQTERYEFDFGLCSTQKGWAQLDTGQDASYFGIWCNPVKREILTYCEGDISLQIAANDEELVNAIYDIQNFYNKMGYGFKGIDAGLNEELKTHFVRLGLTPLLH